MASHLASLDFNELNINGYKLSQNIYLKIMFKK